MEPKLKKKEFRSQKKIVIIVSILVVSLFIGSSFSLLSNSDETEEVVSFKTGYLNMEVSTTGTLSLAGELPKSYNDGFNNKDITLTLKNTGSIEIGKYEVKLEGDNTSTLNSKYIKYSVSEDEGKTYLAAKLLSDTNNIIYTGYSLKDTKVLKVKLWITEDADEEVLKKIYNGKIKVELYQNEDTIVDVVKSKLVSNYSGSNESFPGGLVAVNTNGELYNEENDEEIREYRYSGPTVNNYITFNNELWRILGVFKDETGKEHLKIVINKLLKKDKFPMEYTANNETFNIRYVNHNEEFAPTEDAAYWDYPKEGSTSNNWAEAGLMYWLNSKGTGDDGYLNTLSLDAQNMIYEAKWYLGTLPYPNDDTVVLAYQHERAITGCADNKGPASNNTAAQVLNNTNCRVWANNAATWTGKVAFMYPSDYGFTVDSQYWTTKKLKGEEFVNSVSSTSWLKLREYIHLLSPSSAGPQFLSYAFAGFVNAGRGVSMGSSVIPTIYLKSEVAIVGGDGSLESPYKIAYVNK